MNKEERSSHHRCSQWLLAAPDCHGVGVRLSPGQHGTIGSPVSNVSGNRLGGGRRGRESKHCLKDGSPKTWV